MLACLLLLLTMTLSASAQELPYTDIHSIRNTDAVSMLTDLELLEATQPRTYDTLCRLREEGYEPALLLG